MITQVTVKTPLFFQSKLFDDQQNIDSMWPTWKDGDVANSLDMIMQI